MAIKDLTKVQKIVFICNGGTCNKDGVADANVVELRKHISLNKLDDEVHTVRTKCLGQCNTGPSVFIHPEGVWYQKVDLDISREIVTKHFMNNEIITGHLLFPELSLIKSDPVTTQNEA